MKSYIFLLVLVFLLNSCGKQSTPQQSKTISVSVLPQKYFAGKIAGKEVHINVMIPPGASHSSYEPTAKQLNGLLASSAYLQIGHLDFESAWMERFTSVNSEMKVFDLSEGIELIHTSHNHSEAETDHHPLNEVAGIDPHTWMSPRNAMILSKNILNALLELFPEDSSQFLSNFASLSAEIDSIIILYDNHAEVLRNKNFIIYHPALAYLAKDYKMEQHALEYEGKEPPPSHIRKIIDLAREKDIHYILVQKQLSVDNSRALASEINATIIMVDPMDLDWKKQMLLLLELFTGTVKSETDHE